MNVRRFAAGAVALFATASLAACSSGADTASTSSAAEATDEITITMATTESGPDWDAYIDGAAAAGITLQVQEFSDYAIPNRILAEGEVQANQFQHIKFLAQYNVSNNTDLVPLFSTQIVPLGFYAKDFDSLDAIPEGTEVAIPNDPSNQGRALNVLESAGLLTLVEGADELSPTPQDVDEANSRVRVVPVDAAQTAAAWQNGTPAVINNSFLGRAGIDPNTALYKDDPNDPKAAPYINIVAVRAEDQDNADILRLQEIWASQEVQDAVAEESEGTSVKVDRPQDELIEILRDTEDAYRAAN